MIQCLQYAREEVEWGSFWVRQRGIIVASGDGPYEEVKREAAHYAMIYAQDGPIKLMVRRLKPRHMIP